MYDYKEAIRNCITDYLCENVLPDYIDGSKCFTFREYVLDRWHAILDNMGHCDSVTGLLSGSFTFDRMTAKEHVLDNLGIVAEMAENDFIDKNHIYDMVVYDDWENMDVAIRCYLLPRIWQYEYDLDTFVFS